jgi:hypothetical protein
LQYKSKIMAGGQLNLQPLQIWEFLTGTSGGPVTDPYRGIAIPNKGTIPFAVQVQTITAPANITITSNATYPQYLTLSSTDWYDTDINEGDYVYVAAQGAYRKIKTIFNKTLIEVEYPFASAVTAQNLTVAPRATYRYVRVDVVGSADTGDINGVPMKASSQPQIFNNPTECILYDSSGANEQFKITVGF